MKKNPMKARCCAISIWLTVANSYSRPAWPIKSTISTCFSLVPSGGGYAIAAGVGAGHRLRVEHFALTT